MNNYKYIFNQNFYLMFLRLILLPTYYGKVAYLQNALYLNYYYKIVQKRCFINAHF